MANVVDSEKLIRKVSKLASKMTMVTSVIDDASTNTIQANLSGNFKKLMHSKK